MDSFRSWLHSCWVVMDPMDWLGVVLTVAVLFSLYRAHHNKSMREFNIFDLIMENGRVSRLACVFLATWMVFTWAVIKTVLKGSSEGLALYGTIWAVPMVARMFIQPPAKPPTE